MLRICSLGIAVWLAWQTSAVAQGPKPVEPDRFSAGIVETVSKGALKEAAGSVADVVGQPTGAQNIQSALQVFEGKKFDFAKKVVDKELAGALRQIIYYSYVEKLGFAYFRFHYKMTSKGWILAHFMFKDETQGLLPQEFVER